MEWRNVFKNLNSVSNNRLVLWAAAALVLTAGTAAVITVFRAASASHWVTHTLEVRAAAAQLLSDVQDIETGARGYLLTGEDLFEALQEWRRRGRSGFQQAARSNKLRYIRFAVEFLNKLRPLLVEKRELLSGMIDQAREGTGIRPSKGSRKAEATR